MVSDSLLLNVFSWGESRLVEEQVLVASDTVIKFAVWVVAL